MTTTEKLQRIKELCTANLELAAKRTPGLWETDPLMSVCSVFTYAEDKYVFYDNGICRKEDAAFIAACAGAAEAGWKATLEAIEWLTEMKLFNKLSLLNGGSLEALIISAWEDQL